MSFIIKTNYYKYYFIPSRKTRLLVKTQAGDYFLACTGACSLYRQLVQYLMLSVFDFLAASKKLPQLANQVSESCLFSWPNVQLPENKETHIQVIESGNDVHHLLYFRKQS